MRYRVWILLITVVFTFTLCSCAISAVSQKPKPIPTGPKAITYNDITKLSINHANRVFIDTYKSGPNRDPKWDASVLSFLEYFAPRYMGTVYWDYTNPRWDIPSDAAVITQGKDAVALGCNDPMLLMCLGFVLYKKGSIAESEPFLQRALDEFKKNPKLPRDVARLAPIYLLWAHFDSSDLKPADEKIWRQLAIKWTAEAQCDGSFLPSENRVMYRYLYDSQIGFFEKDRRALYTAAKSVSRPDKYFIRMIGGMTEIKEAWDARGVKFASEVTNQGWKKFKEHLAIGRKLLIEAWKMNPSYPEAPAGMITIAMAGEENSSPRQWFDRAVAAQMDYQGAYDRYEQSILPRWGGSLEELYDFAVECFNTRRYDTWVPWKFQTILNTIENESDRHSSYWSTPETVKRFGEIFDGYAKLGIYNKIDPNYFPSMRAVTMWYCGRNDEAKQLASALGDSFETMLFQYSYNTPYETAKANMDKGILVGDLPKNPENGHYYEIRYPRYGPISWKEADAEAKSLTYKDLKGHLATVTSVSENDFVNSIRTSDQACWAGGFKDNGVWKWTTSEKWSYSSPGKYWDSLTGELYMALDAKPSWAALTKETKITIYMVEYE